MLTPIKTTAQFSIPYYQCLDHHGKIVSELPDFASDADTLLQLYANMVLTRLFDSKAIALQRTGRLGTYPSSAGQEAIAVAIGSTMQADDVFCPYYREFGAMLQRGVKMEEIYLYWGGDERGSAFQNCKEDMPHCVPIASQCLHAVGIATAMKLRKQPRCTVVAIGDGGTSEGDFYEAINVAGAWQLPVVFVINNNQWAISVPRHEQTATTTLAQKGIAGGIAARQVDGNDIIATQAVLAEALTQARAGQGATVIEAITYRLGDHTTADDASRYRTSKECDEAEAKEPLRRLKSYLISQGLWDENKEQQLYESTQTAVEEAVRRYEQTPAQSLSSVFDYLYESLPDAYAEQREEIIAYAEVTP